MPAVERALVVGAGAAGTAVAILLAQDGVSVDLVEVKAEVAGVGSGITLQGNALRVLRELGVWDQARASGYAFDTLGLRAPDPDGTLLVEIDDARMGGPDLPATMGMSRPALATILLERAIEVGVKVRLGTTFTELEQDDDGVTVELGDGARERYDLLIGADGIRSWTRRSLGIELETRRTGMGIWRAFVPRPASVTRTDLFYGGASYIAGYCPTGQDSLYAYVVEDDGMDRGTLTAQEGLEVMRDLAGAYHGPWDDIRELLVDPSTVNYTWFETHLLDAPWHRGRVVLIGDAAHACPPTLAQGAAQALEDASVLAELLLSHDRLDATLWDCFMERRLDRARTVVDASLQLGQWLLDHEQGDVPGLMGRVAAVLTVPS